MNCPCCGQTVDVRPKDMNLTPTEMEIADMLMARPGSVVRIDAIVGRLYGVNPDGGPDDPMNVIRAMVSRLRRKGFHIQNLHGIGYRIHE